MSCSHPRCGVELTGEPVFGRLSRLPYCGARCRGRDNARRKQSTRRAEHPTQKQYERNLKLMAKYGITQADFDQLWMQQEGLCAICKIGLDAVKACVDHNHETLEVRGLLCNVCNQGVGYFGDDPGRLDAAAAYLRSRDARMEV
jgi:hypothetical protein